MGVVFAFARLLARLVRAAAHVVAVVYRLVVVGGLNRSRARRGVPPLDARGLRHLAGVTWFAVGVLALVVVASVTHPAPAVSAPAYVPRTIASRPPMPPIPTITRVWTPAPEPTSEPAPTTVSEAPTGGSDVHVDVDRPHHNLPDGALTGGFCRHHRWC